MRKGKEIEEAWKRAKHIIRNTISEEEGNPFNDGVLPDKYPGEMAAISIITALEIQNKEIQKKLDDILQILAGKQL